MLGLLLLTLTTSLPKDSDFRPYHEEDGVKVEIVQRESGPPWVRGTGEVPATVDAIQAALTRFDTYAELLDGMVKSAKVLESAKDSARLHVVYPYPFPFKNRDAIVRYQYERAGGTFRLQWKQDPKPGDPEEGVRIEHVEGETLVEAVAGKGARVVYTYVADLGGDFSQGTRERAYRKEAPHYFAALRKAVAPRDTAGKK